MVIYIWLYVCSCLWHFCKINDMCTVAAVSPNMVTASIFRHGAVPCKYLCLRGTMKHANPSILILKLPLEKKHYKVTTLQDLTTCFHLLGGYFGALNARPLALREGLGPLTWMPRERCCSWDRALERCCWCWCEQLLCVRLSTQ